ncbi:MAG TPA: endo alpha-1,4 polygalactosaminidase [Polyangiaceae bacterium]|nr:endo alpha-1,4 polygalactosaminidase [Polyangiaceae bacterium]
MPLWFIGHGCSYDVVLERTRATQGGQAGALGLYDQSGGVEGTSNIGGASNIGATSNIAGASNIHPAPALSPGISWQWQLTGTLDTAVDARLFVLDLFDTPAAALERLKASGVVSICQFSAGTSEPWRTDVGVLPDFVLGNAADAEPEETWLDITAPSVHQLMLSRLDLAVSRGCDGVLPDSVDGYGSNTGFPIGKPESLEYLTFLAAESRRRGLVVGLANCAEMVGQAESLFDFVVTTNCVTYRECSSFGSFIEQGKPVLHAELVGDSATGEQRLDSICADTTRRGFSSIVKSVGLSAWRLVCPE